MSSVSEPTRPPQEVGRHDVEPVNADPSDKPLYEGRKKIFPKRANGRFRQLKWIIMAVTLGIYYLTPWLRWDRGEYAPDQAVLIDMANRRFYFFMVEIWPQEFFFVAGLLVMAGIGLFLVTSIAGRAWCGYTCPQTVWTDLFLVIERFIEGDRNARIRLEDASWTLGKIAKRVSKHAIWIVIAVATGGAWIFYFADAPTLADQFIHGEAPTVAYMTVAVLTATTYVFGGLMREQVCIYMCPWPRIQAAMLDEESLTVTYNDWRGEPRGRGKKRKAAAGVKTGDCVDCNACVVVCPMGIDIRDGQQMACITCALCIDACDDVMDKLGRDRGLISYATLADYNTNMAMATEPGTGRIDPDRVHTDDGHVKEGFRNFRWAHLLRPRTFIYTGLWAAIGIAMLFALGLRDRLEVNVLHDRNPVFTRLSDGSVQNGYTIKILNMKPEPRTIRLGIEGLEGGTISVNEINDEPARSVAVPVDPDKLRQLKVYVTVPRDQLPDETARFTFSVDDQTDQEHDEYRARFEVPED
ncbi:cytochrome c oxidase accessory protein CcoG [Notoacmeibacter marinus]|uniref:cytochrome c oxidase accessory protein CcoG n=1 Tax=Notoacmeibacter marinus TaxID=1876515 RepID=UPI000DF47028|nr:cytochrome c oxidase accessory protein CcoG [Notoacmeibacter marinus]